METLKIFFGEFENSTAHWAFSTFLMLLGFLLFKLMSFSVRTDQGTTFDISFWWKHNRTNAYMGLIISYIFIRFFPELIMATNELLSYLKIEYRISDNYSKFFYCLVFGFLFELILHNLKKLFKKYLKKKKKNK